MHESIAIERRWSVYLVRALGGMSVLFGLAAMVLFLFNLDTPVPPMWGVVGGLRHSLLSWLNMLVLYLLSPIVAAALSILILLHRARNAIGWLLLFTGLILGMTSMVGELTVYLNFTLTPSPPAARWIALLTNWLWVVPYSLLIGMIGVFPDGTYLSTRWRWALTSTLGLFFVPISIGAWIETPMSSAYQVANPLLAQTPSVYFILFAVGVFFMPISLLAALAALFVRFQQASLVERQQIKWLLVSIAIMALAVAGGLLLFLASSFSTVGSIIVNVSVVFPLLGIGIALLRYRLYDVDVIINRALVYTGVTATLALVYWGSVVLLQRFFLSGEQSPLVIVFSTLAIAALFTPLRRRIQDGIDRRFFRQKYDAQQVLAKFALTARDETDLDALTGALQQVVGETMQPEGVGVWLKR